MINIKKLKNPIYIVFDNKENFVLENFSNFNNRSLWIDLPENHPEYNDWCDDPYSGASKPHSVTKFGKDLSKVLNFKDPKYLNYNVYCYHDKPLVLKSGKIGKRTSKAVDILGTVSYLLDKYPELKINNKEIKNEN